MFREFPVPTKTKTRRTRKVRAETKALLRDLARSNWFARVGKKERRLVVVSSWQEAMLSRNSVQWLNSHTEAKNLISARLEAIEDEASPYYCRWNKRVDKISPSVHKVLQPMIAKITEREQLPKSFSKW